MMLLLLPGLAEQLPAQESVPASASANFPSGRVEGPFVWESKIYPGTVREYWIYVPAQYDSAKPACSLFLQDGLGRARGWGLLPALDSLIHEQKIPVIIGVFIGHGRVESEGTDNYPRFNRSFEYDALGDRYARFLLEEIIPEVGKNYNLSSDPNDRSIGGASSGAICAFNAAWERPDDFRRVLSTIGTYVGLRGGDEFATLVRKSEPKPLRVFMEDGSSDLNIYAGDWWMANQDMWSALSWAGYEVDHVWGEEGHNSRGAKKIIDRALEWLWQDYPAPVKVHPDQYKGLDLVIPEEPWRVATDENTAPGRLAVNAEGQLYFTDIHNKSLYLLDHDLKPVLQRKLNFTPGGLSFHEDGRIYVANLENNTIVALGLDDGEEVIVSGARADHLLISRQGIYFTETEAARIGYYRFATGQLSYIEVPEKPVGLSLSADQTFLDVSLANAVQGHSFKITREGHLAFGQAYIHYHVPYGQPTPGASAITVDDQNRTYTATDMGIQVADQLGRINFIFSNPGHHQTDVKIGGKERKILYLISDGRLFSRRINARGVLPWQEAVKPPQPRM